MNSSPSAKRSRSKLPSYREYTVCPWGLGYEFMVHVATDGGRLLHAYTYEKDVQELLREDHEDGLKPRHVGELSKNPLFRNLTCAFLREFKAQLEAGISDALKNEVEEERRLKLIGKSPHP
jgi:hypothetical protein